MTDPASDKIFDSFLEEMLTEQHPPDLTEQIKLRARMEFGTSLDKPLRAVRISAKESTNAPDIHARGIHARGIHARGALVAVLAIAAGLLLCFGLWQVFDTRDSAQNAAIADQTKTPNAAPLDGSGYTQGSETNRNASDTIAANDLNRTTIKELSKDESNTAASALKNSPRVAVEVPLESLPFNATVNAPLAKIPATAPIAATQTALANHEVVEQLNSRLESLWKKHDVFPVAAISNDNLIARMNRVLTGADQALVDSSPAQAATRLIRSVGFAEHWADRMVSLWLRGTPVADAADKDGIALRSVLAQHVVSKTPWNQVFAELVSTTENRPQAAFLAALAGGGNHRLVNRVGAIMLDEAIGCARCHDASDDGRLISIDQDEYWSLVAMFSGIDVQVDRTAGSRSIIDKQGQLFSENRNPNIFFERPDGRLQAARFRLPQGDNWRALEGTSTPRESLARWISSTTVSDQAAVNLAWRFVFGRPLMAQQAALETADRNDRAEILVLLTEQYQAHNRDIAQLVEWLVTSKAFAVEPLRVDRQSWLLADDAQIAKWNNAAGNFAVFTPDEKPTTTLNSLDQAAGFVAKWSGTVDLRRSTLAQPALRDPAKVMRDALNTSDLATKDDKAPATFLIRSTWISKSQAVYIQRLVASKLTWQQQVEHVAGLVGQSNNPRLQKAADDLLQSQRGDRSRALERLLQSALLVDESL